MKSTVARGKDMGKPIAGDRKKARERAEEEAARIYCDYLFGREGEYYCCRLLRYSGYSERCTKGDEQECPRLGPPEAV